MNSGELKSPIEGGIWGRVESIEKDSSLEIIDRYCK